MKRLILGVAIISLLFVVSTVHANYADDQFSKLMIHSNTFNGDTIFTDSSSYPHTITAHGDVHHSSSQAKFGGTSIHFDGSGDYLGVPDHPNWNFGTQDFTVDFNQYFPL